MPRCVCLRALRKYVGYFTCLPKIPCLLTMLPHRIKNEGFDSKSPLEACSDSLDFSILTSSCFSSSFSLRKELSAVTLLTGHTPKSFHGFPA